MSRDESEIDQLRRDPDLPECETRVLDLPLVLFCRGFHGFPFDERLQAVEERKVQQRVVQTLIQENFDGSDGGVAEFGRERRAELGEFDVVEPVLEASLVLFF